MLFVLEIKGYNLRPLATGVRGKPHLEQEQTCLYASADRRKVVRKDSGSNVGAR
jgi:hypothetical protein